MVIEKIIHWWHNTLQEIIMLMDTIRNQTRKIFQNIEVLIEAIPENEFDTIKGGFKTWRHFYHFIHSMDKNFIDPGNYSEPDFHKKNLDVIFIEDDNRLTKEEIMKYYINVKNKVEKYIGKLDDKKLEGKIKFNEAEYTRLELIFAQLQHIFYHIGYLHCCIMIEKGDTPEYIGLYMQ
jgi:hypothetical protein